MRLRWLLLFILFDVSNGGMVSKVQRTLVFESKKECEDAGRAMARTPDYQKPQLKSTSLCIPESAFDEPENAVQE